MKINTFSSIFYIIKICIYAIINNNINLLIGNSIIG